MRIQCFFVFIFLYQVIAASDFDLSERELITQSPSEVFTSFMQAVEVAKCTGCFGPDTPNTQGVFKTFCKRDSYQSLIVTARQTESFKYHDRTSSTGGPKLIFTQDIQPSSFKTTTAYPFLVVLYYELLRQERVCLVDTRDNSSWVFKVEKHAGQRYLVGQKKMKQ